MRLGPLARVQDAVRVLRNVKRARQLSLAGVLMAGEMVFAYLLLT